MPKIKTVIFDLDDTLLNRRIMFQPFSKKFVQYFFPSATDKEYKQIRKVLEKYDHGGFSARPQMFEPLYRELKTEKPPDKKLLQFWGENFPLNAMKARFPSTERTLLALKKRGFHLGIITNGDTALQNKKIDNSNLRHFFEHILISGDFPWQKPDVKIFYAALQKFDLSPKQVIYIGDNLINDIHGAHSCGIQTVWANYRKQKNPTCFRPDYEIHVLEEILKLDLLQNRTMVATS